MQEKKIKNTENRIDTFQISQRIKKKLDKQGKNQKWLSKMTGFSPSSISDLLKGESTGGVEKYAKIAAALEADLHWLIFGRTFDELKQLIISDNIEGKEEYGSQKERQKLVTEILDLIKELDIPELNLIKEIATRFQKK